MKKKDDKRVHFAHFNFWLLKEHADKIDWIRQYFKMQNNIAVFAYLIDYVHAVLLQHAEYVEKGIIPEKQEADETPESK